MKGFLTTFTELANNSFDDVTISNIEIPSIQRDYAQGRRSMRVDVIREDFLDVLLNAAVGGVPVGLDFIYGEVEDEVFYPLDGQQRLTTLFLIHWYVASAAAALDPEAGWTKFSYATRPSARLFCQRLVKQPFPDDGEHPSTWLVDQPWFLHTWHTDPSIQSMLVVLDEIHTRIASSETTFDPFAGWHRLTDGAQPAISFYLLPLDDMQSADELYITMNSRGKPLTDFENFKATFENDISHSPRSDEFARKVDGAWSDLLWPLHGGDFLVDDEFMRLIDYIVEICELREGRLGAGSLTARARAVFGIDNSAADENLGLLFEVFDIWSTSAQIEQTFDRLLSVDGPGSATYDPVKVIVYGNTATNLFEECSQTFDSQTSARTRTFSLQQSLLLYAVLLHEIHETPDFARRLRILRNLIADSEDEVRRPAMPGLVADVETLVLTGELDRIKTFSSKQVADERRKAEVLGVRPALETSVHRLEDNPLLRGNLSAFDVAADEFADRSVAFEVAFSDPDDWASLTGGLLATGDYFRKRRGSAAWQFGTGSPRGSGVWRYLLTGATRDDLSRTRDGVAAFLDTMAELASSIPDHCDALIATAIDSRAQSSRFDWQYYLLQYPEMRSGDSGIYHGVDGQLGFELCMLKKTRLNSYYRDPILLQCYRNVGSDEDVMENPWFTGWTTSPRRLTLRRSGATVQNVVGGFALTAGSQPLEALSAALEEQAPTNVVEEKVMLQVRQQIEDKHIFDLEDRVEIGTNALKLLLDAGF